MKKELSKLCTTNPTNPNDPQGIQKYYQTIIDNMPNNVYWLNRDCVTMGCNKNTLKLIGLERLEDFIGITYEEMGELAHWTEDQAQSFKKDDMEVMETGIAKYNVEEPPLYDKDGNPVYYMSSRVPLFDEHNQVMGVIGISVDITELKLTKLKLIKAKEEAESANRELIKEKEKAEAANRAKTEFLGSMSHDMKSPLVGIVSSAEVIAYDETIPKRIRDFAAIISNSGKQLESLFSSCLELSKMEMDEWASRKTVFSIKKLLNDIQALYLPKALSRKLELNMAYDENLPSTVEGHYDSLYRILLNLAGNAIKFTEQGSITLHASQLSKQDQTIWVEFQVQDTGIGIPEDQHEVIFEKLHRLTPSYKNQIEGSGIGLYIVDQYVKRMGGQSSSP